MSIRINPKKCIGCRKCVEECPGNLFVIGEDNKAHMRDPRDCWGCATCVKICPLNAISMYLGADIGGDGTSMIVKHSGNVLHWIFESPDGMKLFVETDRTESNKY
ncbi:4Fe-4S dicluster domain-containing protein [Candidatus Weimeria sp. HCP3S3_B5]|uniref:4Fe-4S dicluster domain-containing protein n=1 Tax=Candidatus Weimeria sp. HCP3S3_B5 TaxID=3438871 RepID=UPI003024F1B5|nr:4Fe-4S binding protein [Lachnospiraceae bacterium]